MQNLGASRRKRLCLFSKCLVFLLGWMVYEVCTLHTSQLPRIQTHIQPLKRIPRSPILFPESPFSRWGHYPGTGALPWGSLCGTRVSHLGLRFEMCPHHQPCRQMWWGPAPTRPASLCHSHHRCASRSASAKGSDGQQCLGVLVPLKAQVSGTGLNNPPSIWY